MDNNIVIRKMGMEDLDGVHAVECRSFSIPWSRQAFMDELGNSCAVYFVAELHGRVIAYAGVWIILDEAHITNVAVDPDFRGRHIAKGLMIKILETANENYLTGITLEVRESNSVAICLYKQFGFQVEGRRKAYYSDNGEDALVMWRRLSGAGNSSLHSE